MKSLVSLLTVLVVTVSASSVSMTVFAAPAETSLGRLFFTPERRMAMERQRQFNIMEAQSLSGATLSLDGVIVRSTGKSTIWVNGRPSDETDAERSGVSAELRRDAPGNAVLTTGDDTRTALKVGETINRGTGDRNDRLGGGAVVTNNKK